MTGLVRNSIIGDRYHTYMFTTGFYVLLFKERLTLGLYQGALWIQICVNLTTVFSMKGIRGYNKLSWIGIGSKHQQTEVEHGKRAVQSSSK